jgi:hypothetical protein
MREGPSRLAFGLAAARPGLSTDTARELLASTFDVFIEMGVLPDGSRRVKRIAEPAGIRSNEIALRNVFALAVGRTQDGTMVGSMYATGVVPRIVQDMIARGVPVDGALFSRPWP